jgi:hypothetical protein
MNHDDDQVVRGGRGALKADSLQPCGDEEVIAVPLAPTCQEVRAAG